MHDHSQIPKTFPLGEAETLFSLLGYVYDNKGKTSGFRARFKKGDMAYLLHKPHPDKAFKPYAVKQMIEFGSVSPSVSEADSPQTHSVKHYPRIYNKRQASDYDDFMDIPLDEAYQLYPEVKSFVNIIIRLVKE